MKKKLFALALSLCFAVAVLAACGDKAAELAQFDVPDETKFVEVGETYKIPSINVTDTDGRYYVPEVSVKDTDGKDVAVTDNGFVASVIGDYTVTYTVVCGDKRESKSFTVECFDSTPPEIVSELNINSIALPGTKLALSQLTARDNSGESVTPEITVSFGDETVEPIDGEVTFSEKGTYVINVKAADSSGNAADVDYKVYTEMTFEDGHFFENQWYVTKISALQAHRGENAYQFGAFDTNITWFDDFSMLGEIAVLSPEATRLSAWIYFDTEAAGFTGDGLTNTIYYDMAVYNVYGDPVNKNFQDKFAFKGNNWYRMVIDLDKPIVKDYEPITNLNDFRIYFGVWDTENNVNATVGCKIYLDDIRLMNPDLPDDEAYDEKPAPPVSQYEKGELIRTIGYEALVAAVHAADRGWVDYTAAEATFLHGRVKGELKQFEESTATLLGNKGGVETPHFAVAENWRCYTGKGDGFVYAVKAKGRMFLEMTPQAGNAISGWVDDGVSTVKAYVKAADGTVREIHSEIATSAAKFLLSEPVLLEKDEIFYYEYCFGSDDSRNISFPPDVSLYAAAEKAPAV